MSTITYTPRGRRGAEGIMSADYYTQGNMDNTCTVAERSLGDQASSSEDHPSSLDSSSLGSSSLAS